MWQYDEHMKLKVGLAEMLKGGVIMDVTTADQAKIAEDAGATAVMALERVPADIRKEGGVARMASARVIKEIMAVVSIPVMAKARIGHFAEAQVLEVLGVDYVDESEVLTPADEAQAVAGLSANLTLLLTQHGLAAAPPGQAPDLILRCRVTDARSGSKFKRMVVPGDQLIMDVEIIWIRGLIGKMKGVARVDGEIAASMEMTFKWAEKDQ